MQHTVQDLPSCYRFRDGLRRSYSKEPDIRYLLKVLARVQAIQEGNADFSL